MSTWLERRMNAQTEGFRDGEAPALEEAAAEAKAPPAAGRPPAVPADPAVARRAVIEEALAEKVLRAHLHNALQIAFPLVLNFGNHSPAEAALLAEIAAAAATSGPAVETRARSAEILATVGADPETVERFRRAAARPRPLNEAVGAIAEAGLEAHAYAAALLVLPRPAAAEQAFLDYLAARLGLKAEVVSGLSRRYRR